MEYTEDPEKMKTWAPLMMKGRDDKERLGPGHGTASAARRLRWGKFFGVIHTNCPKLWWFPKVFRQIFHPQKNIGEDKWTRFWGGLFPKKKRWGKFVFTHNLSGCNPPAVRRVQMQRSSLSAMVFAKKIIPDLTTLGKFLQRAWKRPKEPSRAKAQGFASKGENPFPRPTLAHHRLVCHFYGSRV